MDRVVQKAMLLVLASIYEPYFEAMNRSFGFRPGKGTMDAIAALKSKSNGMRTMVEGDIEEAFPSVDKGRLLEIMSETISDRGFLKLYKDRLDYRYLESDTNEIFEVLNPFGVLPVGGPAPRWFST
jgi:retron-type reverse transcriptase